MASGRLTTIFAKKPAAGAVTTRLCPPLTPAAAAELALAMLDDTVEKCLGSTGFRTSIRASPAGESSWFRERYAGVFEVVEQEGEGLGERLARHFEQSSRVHPEWTLACIGADSPQVPAQRIEASHRALERGADLVLGPDRGGGYYLVALRRPRAELFTGVEMSTPGMCERTIELARSFGLRVVLLEADFDVDGPEDLRRLALCSPSLRSAALAARHVSSRA
jgi:rSAM/selenodomain-associated transferase 1